MADSLSRAEWSGAWPTDPTAALVDAAALPFPWTLRPWHQGDRFRPLGMRGSKLVSDILREQQFSLPERDHVWVLEAAETIVWVVGVRLAHTARVTDKSQHVVNFRLIR